MNQGFLGKFTTLNFNPVHLHSMSAWRGHAHFGMFIVEAVRPKLIVDLGVHFGTSTFAFCQAAKILGLNTKIFGIDLWPYDGMPEMKQRQAHEHVIEWAEEMGYRDVLVLLRENFYDAVNRFEDGSIELLHIDGNHKYEFVKKDFETYLPKLNPRKSVVMFHDTRLEREGCEVNRFYAEIKDNYPNLEMTHSFGLGVIATGWEELPEDAKLMFTYYKGNVVSFFEEKYRRTEPTVKL